MYILEIPELYSSFNEHLAISGLQKLAPRAQKFGLVIRTYVPVGHAEKYGA